MALRSREKEGLAPRESALDGFGHVPVQNETALAQAVSQHPVAVAVCCGDYIDNWHAYTGGIFNIPGTGAISPWHHKASRPRLPPKMHVQKPLNAACISCGESSHRLRHRRSMSGTCHSPDTMPAMEA